MVASHPDRIFPGRREAGLALAAKLEGHAPQDAVVVAMPRGGVPVAAEVAARRGAEFDIAVVRKLGAPGRSELAFGAIAEDGAVVVDGEAVDALRISPIEVERVRERESRELDRRVALYREHCPRAELAGRDAILIDDGLATGATAAAAARSLKARGAARIVLAVPVCPRETSGDPPDPAIDELVYVIAPPRMMAVGYWYENFPQVLDSEVIADLARISRRSGESGGR